MEARVFGYLARVAAAGARTESFGHPPASVPPLLPSAGLVIAPRAAELELPVDVDGVSEQPTTSEHGEEPDATDTRASDISRSPHEGQAGNIAVAPAEPPAIPAVRRTRALFPAEVPSARDMGTVTAHELRPSSARDAASMLAAPTGAPVPAPAGHGTRGRSGAPASGPTVNATGAPSPWRSGDPLSRPLPPLPSLESLSAAPARLGDVIQAGAGGLAPALQSTPRLSPRVPGLPTPAQPPAQSSTHALDAVSPQPPAPPRLREQLSVILPPAPAPLPAASTQPPLLHPTGGQRGVRLTIGRIDVQVQNQPQALPRTQAPPPPPSGTPVNGYLERFWLKP